MKLAELELCAWLGSSVSTSPPPLLPLAESDRPTRSLASMGSESPSSVRCSAGRLAESVAPADELPLAAVRLLSPKADSSKVSGATSAGKKTNSLTACSLLLPLWPRWGSTGTLATTKLQTPFLQTGPSRPLPAVFWPKATSLLAVSFARPFVCSLELPPLLGAPSDRRACLVAAAASAFESSGLPFVAAVAFTSIVVRPVSPPDSGKALGASLAFVGFDVVVGTGAEVVVVVVVVVVGVLVVVVVVVVVVGSAVGSLA